MWLSQVLCSGRVSVRAGVSPEAAWGGTPTTLGGGSCAVAGCPRPGPPQATPVTALPSSEGAPRAHSGPERSAVAQPAPGAGPSATRGDTTKV